MPPELLFICGLFMWVQFGSIEPMYLLLGSALIVLSQHVTAIVPTKRPKLTPKNPLKTLDDKQFKKEFRFAKKDIARLVACLQWPPFFRHPSNGMIFSSEICLLMVLYRFAFPSTLNKVEIMFGVWDTYCSYIVSHGVNMLYAKFGTRLYAFDTKLVLARLHIYMEAIRVKSQGAATTYFGLLDGTVHYISRPCPKSRFRRIGNNNNIQRATNSDHKRKHCLKFQSVVVPDGMVAQMFGPVEGRRHDLTLLKLSNLHERMQLLPGNAFLYGDQAYPLKPWLLSPFKGANKPAYMRLWNRRMRTVRISVEHGFKIITSLFAHLKYVPGQTVFKTAVVKQYVVCTALANMHNCLYPNQVAQHFGVAPPTLEEYCAMYV